MKSRLIFWLALFSLPIALAVLASIRLQRERGVLQAKLAEWHSVLSRHQAALREADGHAASLAAQKQAIEARLKEAEARLSPWERRMLAARREAARLAAEDRTAVDGAGASRRIVQAAPSRPYFYQLLDDPAYSKAVAALMRLQAEGEFGRLLSAVNLSPADREKLATLLGQWDMAHADANALIAGTGLDHADTLRATNQVITQEIADTFGPQVAGQLAADNHLRWFYQGVDAMTSRLSYTDTPLAPGQADQLAATIAQDYGTHDMSWWVVSDQVMTQAQGFLTPAQLEVLQQIQQERQAVVQGRHSRADARPAP